MHPKLRHLESVVAKTKAVDKVLRVTGGAPDDAQIKVRVGHWTLVGRLGDLQVEDTDAAAAHVVLQEGQRKHG